MSYLKFNELVSSEFPEELLSSLIALFKSNHNLTTGEAENKIAQLFKFKSISELKRQLNSARRQYHIGKELFTNIQKASYSIKKFPFDTFDIPPCIRTFLCLTENNCINLSTKKQYFFLDYISMSIFDELEEAGNSDLEAIKDIQRWIDRANIRLQPNIELQLSEFLLYKIKYGEYSSTGDLMDFDTGMHCYARFNIETKTIYLNEFWVASYNSNPDYLKPFNQENNLKQKFDVIERIFESLLQFKDVISEFRFVFEIQQPESFLKNIVFTSKLARVKFDHNISFYGSLIKRKGGYLELKY